MSVSSMSCFFVEIKLFLHLYLIFETNCFTVNMGETTAYGLSNSITYNYKYQLHYAKLLVYVYYHISTYFPDELLPVDVALTLMEPESKINT